MRRLVFCAVAFPLVLLSLASCESRTVSQNEAESKLFGPKTMRVHPTFTRVKDWTGDGRPDGIEAVVELQDAFGEPTRATGAVMVELYHYRPTHPDVRGARVPEVWVWPLQRRNEQVAHWSRALRAYSFKINFDPGRTPVVLEATFDFGESRGRMSSQVILEPAAPAVPVTPPATAPTTVPSLLG
jgi:hypothetical protein